LHSDFCRASDRYYNYPAGSNNYFGFRVARNP